MKQLRRPQKILFPVDFSVPSKNAARLVEAIAQRFNSSVVLVHVVEPVAHPFEMFGQGGFDPRPVEDVALKALQDFARTELKASECKSVVLEGDPAIEIVDLARTENADLIVITTRGHGRFRRMLLGSVSAKILNDSEIPVLTGAHIEALVGEALVIRNIVCAVDYDEKASSALHASCLLASGLGANLTVVHASDLNRPSLNADFKRYIHEQIEDIRESHGIPVEFVLQTGEPSKVIGETASRVSADLVVIGRSTPGPLGRLRTKSYSIIRESLCPVLSV